jgi:hypothetical protein
MMEAASTSEALANFYRTARRYKPEDSHIQAESRLLSYVYDGKSVHDVSGLFPFSFFRRRQVIWHCHSDDEGVAAIQAERLKDSGIDSYLYY